MAYGQFVDPIFVAGIYLLSCSQHARDRALHQIAVFPQFPQDLPVFFHTITQQQYTHTRYDVSTNTPHLVYNYTNNNRMEGRGMKKWLLALLCALMVMGFAVAEEEIVYTTGGGEMHTAFEIKENVLYQRKNGPADAYDSWY